MDRAEFWAMIDATRGDGEAAGQFARLRTALAALPVEDILDFGRIRGELMRESYRADLWGAAYLIGGGCSDDAFDYFRGWLISRGEAVFRAALADPDSLADEASEEGDDQFEELGFVDERAYRDRTGRDDFYELPRPPSPSWDFIGDLADWADEDGDGIPERLEALYPRLFRKYDN